MADQPLALENRLIVFADLLGFSHQLETRSPDEVHAQYSTLIDKINARVFDAKSSDGKRANNFAVARFMFDSLVAVSQPIEGEGGCHNAFNFLCGIMDLFTESFGARAPMRGCVGFGSFLDDSARGIFVSRQWPELVRAEKQFDWSGITVLTNAADVILDNIGRVPDGLQLDAGNLLVEHEVPLKAGGAMRCWCLNWAYLCPEPSLQAGFGFLNAEKRPGTENFVAAVRAMPAHSKSIRVPPKFHPVVEVRLQLTLCGLRVACFDSAGRTVNPPEGSKFVFQVLEARKADTPVKE